jgi:cytochrome c biogenesis protein CcmG/thiol:disulfide interchange protein DsbE
MRMGSATRQSERLMAWVRALPPARALQAIALACVLLAGMLALAVRTGAPPAEIGAKLVGRPAPAFVLPAERDGHLLPGTISLAAQRGHPVLLLFTFSLCPHCLPQALTVRRVAARNTVPGLRVLYVDSPGESPDIVAAYQQRLVLDAPVLLDAGGVVAARYGVTYYPTTVLIDGQGVVRRIWIGETGAAPVTTALRAGTASASP